MQKSANERKRAQMNAKERKRKSAKTQVHKRAQKGAKERFRVKITEPTKKTGLKQPGLGTPKVLQTQHSQQV